MPRKKPIDLDAFPVEDDRAALRKQIRGVRRGLTERKRPRVIDGGESLVQQAMRALYQMERPSRADVVPAEPSHPPRKTERPKPFTAPKSKAWIRNRMRREGLSD